MVMLTNALLLISICVTLGAVITSSTDAKLLHNTTALRDVATMPGNMSSSVFMTPQRDKFSRLFCYKSSEPEPEYRNRCCASEVYRFRLSWQHGGYFLTTLLERLQRWNCDEFRQECNTPSYNFTAFNSVVYERFCFPDSMHRQCKGKVLTLAQNHRFPNTTGEWTDVIEHINPEYLSGDELKDPCISVALFDRSSGGVGRFQEIVEVYLPFCGLQWNGYDTTVSMRSGVSVWTGLSFGCRGALIFFMVLMGLLGIATVVANGTILAVFASNKKLRNSQAIFQMSLAVADLIVGLLVWPNMIVMQCLLFLYPRNMGDVVTEERLTVKGIRTYFPNFGTDKLERRYPALNSAQFNHDYRMFLGFIMLLSILVSIMTLMAASFDRLYAISFPLRHRRKNPKTTAIKVCVAVWLLCIFFCILPIVIPALEYNTISSIFASADGTYGTTLALVALIVPMVMTWVVSGATYETSRRHGLRTKSMFATAKTNSSKNERRLAKTLCLMVGVFTISVLPAIICVVCGAFFIRTEWANPASIDLAAMNAYSSVEYIAVIVLTMNSLWNCLIYSLRNMGFRKAARNIFSREDSRRNSSHGTTRLHTTSTTVTSKRVTQSIPK